MNRTYEIKKPQLATVAFLGLLIIALLTARLIVARTATIVLSPPIALEYLGVAVSLPSGHGWKCQKQWRYNDDCLSIGTVFASIRGNPSAQVICRYFPAAQAMEPQARLANRAVELEGAIAKKDRIELDKTVVHWAHISRGSGILLDVFFGTIDLPGPNRAGQLDIEVTDTTGDVALAWDVFRRVTDSLKIDDEGLLEAGKQIVAAMKSKGLAAFLDNQNRQTLFMVTDSRRRNVGFTMDVLVDSGPAVPMNIQAAGMLYLKSGYVQDHATSFRSDDKFSQYHWRTQAVSTVAPAMADRSSTTMRLDESGILTVAQSDPRRPERKYRLGAAAIPDAVLDLFLQQMIGTDANQCVVDVIESDGRIVPTLVTRLEVKNTAANKDVAYVIRLEFLDGHGFYELAYLDSHRNISRVLIQQQELYFLERTPADELTKAFPERADLIVQPGKADDDTY